jgi:CelD/BcsL family acetyltransferase involved in cellulose biosynthesis
MSESETWQLVSNQTDFLRLQSDWEQLFEANPRHSPFLAWGWVNAWLTHIAGQHQLQIVCLRNNAGELIFVLPMLERTGRREIGSARVALVCSYGPECSEHLGCLCIPGLEPRSAELSARAIAQFFGGHGRMSLGCLDNDTDYPLRLQSSVQTSGRTTRLRPDVACPTVRLPASWEEYLQQLSSNFRSQVRRSFKRVGEEGQPHFRSLDQSEAEGFALELIRLNRSRIAAKGEVSSLQDETFRNFLSEAIPYMASCGLAWMDTFEREGQVLGAALNFVHGDTVYYYMGGFDNTANKLRPGTALFAAVIQRSIDAGIVRYDFLRGAESYKYRWGADDVSTHHLTIYPRGVVLGPLAFTVDYLYLTTRNLLGRARRLLAGKG